MIKNKDEEHKLYGTVLIKAKRILDFLTVHTTAPTLAELSSGLNIPKPTTLKILDTLTYLGIIRKDQQTLKYYLGTELIAYGEKAKSSINISRIAMPYLKKLRDQTKETVNLGIVENEKIILINKLESTQSIKLQSTIGGSMQLYCSGMGKAVLATYSEHDLNNYLNTHKLVPYTPRTITSISLLKDNLKIVRETGFATDNEEKEEQVFCIGSVIKKANIVYGAFSVSLPKFRLTDEKRSKLIQLVLQTQQNIDSAL